jgi:hypothetical protein
MPVVMIDAPVSTQASLRQGLAAAIGQSGQRLLIPPSSTNSLPIANPPPSEASRIAIWAISFRGPRGREEPG